MDYLLHQKRQMYFTLRESRELSFAMPDHSENVQPETDPDPLEATGGHSIEPGLTKENVDTVASVSAAQAIEEAEKMRMQHLAQQRAALEAQGKLEKHADVPLTRVDHARLLNGDFGEILLPFSTKTDNEYGVLHTNPSEKQKAYTLKVAHTEKAEIEKYIAEHQKEWDADQDVSRDSTMSIAKRHLMSRLARIEEIERYNPNRRQEALAWREKQRVASEASEREYQDTLESLWAAAPNERYPLPSGFDTFIKDFAVPLFLKTQQARRTFENTSTRSPVYETNRELYQVAKELERQRIDMNYAKWRDTPFEDVFRNRFAQLQDDTSEYKTDLARIAEPMTEEQKIAEFFDSKEKGSSEKFRKRDRQGRVLYSNLSDFEREEYLRYKGSAQAKTITQWEFDKKHFRYAGTVSHENVVPRLAPELVAKLHAAIDSLALNIQEQPEQTYEIAAGQCSPTALRIAYVLNTLIRENSDAKSADVVKVFLSEMKKMGPQRIKSVAGNSFSIKDDDGQFRWYELVVQSNGVFRIDNVNPVVEYKHVDDEERKKGVKDHVVYREPEEEMIDTEWSNYAASNNAELPDMGDGTVSDSPRAELDSIGESVRQLRDSMDRRKAVALENAVRYFNDVQMFETRHNIPLPDRHKRQVERMKQEVTRMFEDGDNSGVNALIGQDAKKLVERMVTFDSKKDTHLPEFITLDASRQIRLTQDQEVEKMQSIEMKGENHGWIDGRLIHHGTPGWSYKFGEDGQCYARFNNIIQKFMPGRNVWEDLVDMIVPEDEKDVRRLFSQLVKLHAEDDWVELSSEPGVTYHIDMEVGSIEKKEHGAHFSYFKTRGKGKWHLTS